MPDGSTFDGLPGLRTLLVERREQFVVEMRKEAAVLDEQRKIVTAMDISGAIVRIAAFRDSMGCTVLPPHWQLGDVPRLPNVQYAPPPDVTRVPFPQGDRVDLPASGLDSRTSAEGHVRP